MGFAGKLEEKELAIELRGKGLSYGEILRQVEVSKSTLSRWCRDVIMSPAQLGKLRQKKLMGAERGRIIGAKKQQLKRIRRTEELLKDGKKDVGKLDKRDRFIAGIGLYLGDGTKGDREVGFSNSNPTIIRFMVGWLREFCLIPEKKFRGQIWIHDNQSELEARRYWSKLTGIPVDQFHESYISKNKTRSKKIRKKRHDHGIFAIRVSSTEIQRKILGWMGGITENDVV
ncbi:MAG: hypothetical protein ABID04_02695 [Patescibacteria group bacterium]